ncbi:MAG: p-cumate 2,3-dioxygenase subunit beta [Mycobacterium sp.]|jgi:p-cumate 2,3-dioxygenase beta subunit|uniref:aromatic-ring-hydroxylating dioxygenase subunit beta n=1 Tax=Mycobacterium sp. TaxID=1785 RepID=UPI0028B93AFC|nr:aromatic-ring-hydroxylating dioxygenase subunit beta [Mycobacterium sp.]MDT5114417.1 p-cumate 2,3-dioxygenase subunit beta [Mycobacterium sp.]
MSTVLAVSRQQVEDFLYAETALLDAWSLDDWLELFDPDAKYEVPCNDTPDGDPDTDVLLIDDDYTRLHARVTRLNSRRAHREYPHSRTNHQIFNVIVADPNEDDGIGVTASFTVWRFRGSKTSCYVGRYRYRLRRSDNGLRIAFKRAELDMTDLRAVSDVAIIL